MKMKRYPGYCFMAVKDRFDVYERQCARKAVVTVAGRRYCKQHGQGVAAALGVKEGDEKAN